MAFPPDETRPAAGDSAVPIGRVGRVGRPTLKDLAMFLPNFVVLLKRLIFDPRVPFRSKLMLGGVVAYLVSPIDVIPDFVPGLGQLDDIVLALLAIHGLLNRVDESVILEHWDGDQDLIKMVRAGVGEVARLLPGGWEKKF